MKKIILLVFVCFHCCLFYGQKQTNVVLIPTGEDFFAYCKYNSFNVVARQSTPITIDKIKARLVIGFDPDDYEPIYGDEELILEPLGENEFKISTSLSQGTIEFEIELESGTEKIYQELQTIPVRVTIGGKELSSHSKLSVQRLKQCEGVSARLKYNGLLAKGTILEFKLIGIIKGQLQPEILNTGGRFNQEALALLQQLNPRDLILVRDVYHKNCHQTEKYKNDFIIELE